MLEIRYEKLIPYPFEVVLSQYFDFEHIAHVHPQTLGEYVLVESCGHRIVYDQIWPANWMGRRSTSRVVQTWLPPNRITFAFTAGKHRGTLVRTRLQPQGDSTLVDETYVLKLPSWPWLGRLLRPWVVRSVERVWEEDLRVAVCIGGSPGVPGTPARAYRPEWLTPLLAGRYLLGTLSDFTRSGVDRVTVAGVKLSLIADEKGYRAVSETCPHAGGPLSLGATRRGQIVCPWHGACFDTRSGQPLSGPTSIPLNTYAVEVVGDQLFVISEFVSTPSADAAIATPASETRKPGGPIASVNVGQ